MSQRAVYKTTSAEYLDRAYSDPAAIPIAMGRLDGGSLVDVAQQLEDAGDLPEDSADMFSALIDSKGPGTVEQVLRSGYRAAFEMASDRSQPVETFWVTAPGDDFELHICEGRQSILVFFFIPGEEGRDYGSLRAQSRSWVVRAGDRSDVRSDAPRITLDEPIVQIQVSGANEDLS
jgi:hypothetical protein